MEISFLIAFLGNQLNANSDCRCEFAGVKKNIETVQGDVYPTAQQMLIHQGKVLKDPTTLEENKVAENSFIVIMLSKTKAPSGEASTAATAPR
ncbi:hypothetical protein L1887_11948 [Cichorium endivia]|nr:hypothetical protein L1887_11948 [Cichorium endivia]